MFEALLISILTLVISSFEVTTQVDRLKAKDC